MFCSNKSTDQPQDLSQFINQVNSVHSFGTNLSQLMLIRLPNEQAFGVACVWLPCLEQGVCKCLPCSCSPAAQLLRLCLLMVAPLTCLWSLFPDEKQLSIPSLTLHQLSSTGKMRLLKLSSITPLPAVALELVLGMV